jgi:hypothetical protein
LRACRSMPSKKSAVDDDGRRRLALAIHRAAGCCRKRSDRCDYKEYLLHDMFLQTDSNDVVVRCFRSSGECKYATLRTIAHFCTFSTAAEAETPTMAEIADCRWVWPLRSVALPGDRGVIAEETPPCKSRSPIHRRFRDPISAIFLGTRISPEIQGKVRFRDLPQSNVPIRQLAHDLPRRQRVRRRWIGL